MSTGTHGVYELMYLFVYFGYDMEEWSLGEPRFKNQDSFGELDLKKKCPFSRDNIHIKFNVF